MIRVPLGNRQFNVMAARLTLLQATWNYERQQGLGWAWSLEPALERIYPDPAVRRERLAQHTAYFNTQPTLASVALGAGGAPRGAGRAGRRRRSRAHSAHEESARIITRGAR
jgi:mannose/fructose/N-acetylgalactosamine-specific phosphotransferase system component IID